MSANKCDYKIKRISFSRKKVVVDINIYEGEVSILDEFIPPEGVTPVTRYRRSGKLDNRVIVFDRPINIHSIKGNLNNILKDDFSHRTPIDEQT